MTDTNTQNDLAMYRTRTAYIWTNLLGSPFWVLFNILPFILYKDLGASPLQITIITALKPLVSLISFYWGASIYKRRDRLINNVVWAKILGLLPFFFFPFIENVWFMIGSFALYMMFFRGANPAWMEILKLNLHPSKRNSVFAAGSFVAHIGEALLPFVVGWLLDSYIQAWRWLFPITALISLSSAYLKSRIPINLDTKVEPQSPTPPLQQLTAPWEGARKLLNERPDFLRFLIGFMLGGAGMMIAQPLLPLFFDDILHLSYTEMSVAITFCKGVGFSLTTPLWTRYLEKVNFFQICALPPLGICLFSACLISAQYHIAWLFVAYVCYGIVQAGSHLCWNLSGPIFAREDDSTPYSNVNVLAVGVRGCFIPPLGALLGYTLGPSVVIAVGGILCFIAALTLSRGEPKKSTIRT